MSETTDPTLTSQSLGMTHQPGHANEFALLFADNEYPLEYHMQFDEKSRL